MASKLLYSDHVCRRTITFFNIKRGSWIHICKILSDTTIIMLERTMNLAIMLLLVQINFKITDLMVNIIQKYRQKIKVNQQQVNINFYVRGLQSLLCRKIYEFFETFIFALTFIFHVSIFLHLSVINSSLFTRVLVIEI